MQSAIWLLLVLVQLVGGTEPSDKAQEPAPAPSSVPYGRCPFTLRVAGQLIGVSEAPEQARYIISCHTMEQRAELARLLAEVLPGVSAGASAPTPLTQTMPLLVGSLSRPELAWLCQNPEASACIRYIERDERVSLV